MTQNGATERGFSSSTKRHSLHKEAVVRVVVDHAAAAVILAKLLKKALNKKKTRLVACCW